MPHDSLGPQAHRVYIALREHILDGQLAPGTRFPSQRELALTFGVALMTVRQALARLEGEGLIACEHGRGTFVREQQVPQVLIVEDAPLSQELMADYVIRAGYNPVAASNPEEAKGILQRSTDIALILSDVRVPTTEGGIEFFRWANDHCPDVPLAAITGYPDDLVELQRTPECPFIILTKPIRSHQIEGVLKLALRRPAPVDQRAPSSATLLAIT
jgi:DNA-binding transcriptional regulator YhcF (GntR family)